MYNSGDAAEQVVRMSLEGAEVALKITGAAAKNLAAALYTVLKDQKKTKGKARIETMLREKRPLKVYTIKKEDCPEFARQAKGYGILYAPIPVRKEDDTIDILVQSLRLSEERQRRAENGHKPVQIHHPKREPVKRPLLGHGGQYAPHGAGFLSPL